MSPLSFRRELKQRADRVRNLVELLSKEHVRFGPAPPPGGGYIQLDGGSRVRSGRTVVSFSLGESWMTTTEGAAELHASRYTLADASTGLEIFAYHYHPPSPPAGHFHMGSGAGNLIESVHRAHFPAPGARLEDLVAMLIRDFRVRPRRPDWQRVLAEES